MKTNQDGLQVLPWHREAAKELNEVFNLYCWDEAKDDAAAIIARHDPHESPLFTSRVLVPKLNAEIESLKAQHAETLRLLKEVYRNTNLRHHPELVGLSRIVGAHLAAQSKPSAHKSDACDGCIHLHYVSADPFGTSRSGWGCLLSGGHAIKRCGSYKANEAEGKGTT